MKSKPPSEQPRKARRYQAWRAIASFDERLREYLSEQAELSLPSLSAVWRNLRAAADTPWLLVLVVPGVLLASRILPGAAIFPHEALVALAVYGAARRWGLDALLPTLALCPLYLVQLDTLRGFGNVWMIPALLALSRLGADPAFAATVRNYERVRPADLALLLALLLSSVFITAFSPPVVIASEPSGLPTLLLFGLLGGSRVRFRFVVLPLLMALAATWLLAPISSEIIARAFMYYDFGILPVDAAVCCLAFLAGRMVTKPPARNDFLAGGALAAWLALVGIATQNLSLELPFGPFGVSARSILWGTEASSRLNSASQELVPWEMVAIQAVIAWQLSAASRARLAALLPNAIQAAVSVVGAIAAVAAAAERLGPWSPSQLGSLVVATPDRAVGQYDLAVRAASLVLLSLLAVAATRPGRGVASGPPSAPPSRPFLVEVLGRFWAMALPAQALVLGVAALGLSLADPPLTLGGLDRHFSETSLSYVRNPASLDTDNAETMLLNETALNALEAQAEAARDPIRAGSNNAD